jgi:hypothetical protein
MLTLVVVRQLGRLTLAKRLGFAALPVPDRALNLAGEGRHPDRPVRGPDPPPAGARVPAAGRGGDAGTGAGRRGRRARGRSGGRRWRKGRRLAYHRSRCRPAALRLARGRGIHHRMETILTMTVSACMTEGHS